MDFGLSEDQVLLKDTIKRFLAEQCPTTRVRQIMEGDAATSSAICGRELAELGVAGRDRAGGARRPRARAARSGAGRRGARLRRDAGTVPRLRDGDGRAGRGRRRRAAASKWLPALAAGEAVGDDRAGRGGRRVDADRAARRSVAGGRLSGRKPLVPSAQIADVIVVAARDEQRSAASGSSSATRPASRSRR